MGSILSVIGGLWFVGATVFNVGGGDAMLGFPRVVYIGLALIAFSHVDLDDLFETGNSIRPTPPEPERPADD